jgi:putative ABC transport system permease protein
MPDSKRYGIFWMSRRSLEAAVNMKGAFNDLTIKTERYANTKKIKESVDLILKPYGGLISYGRDEHISNFFVENELKQLESMGLMAPIIFLSVAAFLINVVMSRQVAIQREQVGMLKAVGYTNWEVSKHYLKMVVVVIGVGSILGLSLGSWMGAGMTKMYTEFFHFPILKYSFSPEVMIFSVLFCIIAAILGTIFAIKTAATLPPAEAMRPESPAAFTQTFLERCGLHKHLSFLSRIVLRQLERRPIRAIFSVIGIAFAISILVFSFFMEDSMTYLMDIQYDVIQREDVNISFVEARSYRAMEELKVLPGVLSIEPIRNVIVLLKFKHYQKRGAITGLDANTDLRRVVNKQLVPVTMPKNGILLNEKLADILHVTVGDIIEVEVLEGDREKLHIAVAAITQEFIGLGAFMHIDVLNRLLDDEPKVTGVSIMVDPLYRILLYKKLKRMPMVIGLNITSVLRKIFEDIMAENLLKMVSINIIFACFISFGVIYNTARIALSERSRELANLRVLGFTNREVAYIFFGELSIITLISLPLGIFIGKVLVSGMVNSMDSELFRIPTYLNNNTYGYSILIVLVCMIISFYLVWRQLSQIDLVSAQKGVE